VSSKLVGVTSSTEEKRRRQSPETTRRQILDATRAFLQERSFRELNVDALMATTGHSRTLFYRHFDGISGLMLALIEENGAELVQIAQEWVAQTARTPDDARRRLAAFVDFHTRNGAAVRAVLEASHHDDAIEEAYGRMIEAFVAITTMGIQGRIEAGELEPIDAPEVARALVRMINGYLVDPQRSQEPDRALEALVTVWARTLFPAS
jgi:AcrR family transcriptional regulator